MLEVVSVVIKENLRCVLFLGGDIFIEDALFQGAFQLILNENEPVVKALQVVEICLV